MRFVDHVYLGRTQRERKPNDILVDEYSKMFESRISAGATEKLAGCAEVNAYVIAWSYGMEGHAQKCLAGEHFNTSS